MRLYTTPVTTVEMTVPETSGTLEQRFVLFGGMAFVHSGAGVARHGAAEHYHAFADRRAWALCRMPPMC